MSLSRAERAALVDILIHGDDKAANIGQRVGMHRNTISTKLTKLAGEDYLSNKGGGVYRLTDKGRQHAIGLIKAGEQPWQD